VKEGTSTKGKSASCFLYYVPRRGGEEESYIIPRKPPRCVEDKKLCILLGDKGRRRGKAFLSTRRGGRINRREGVEI